MHKIRPVPLLKIDEEENEEVAYQLGLEDVEKSRQVAVLVRDRLQMDHLIIGREAGEFSATVEQFTPLLLGLNEHWLHTAINDIIFNFTSVTYLLYGVTV